MPIRINLLAEQQAAEEARRKDPVKRAIWVGSALVFLTLVWTLLLHMEVKAKRSELANLDADFRKVDEAAKSVRNRQAEAGDIERRIVSLERYSTNRILWATVLDAFQKLTIEQIRFKSFSTSQEFFSTPATNLFTTNVAVSYTPKPPAWKFWAGAGAQPNYLSMASNQFKSFTNAPPFSTNKIPYTVKTSIASTNLDQGVVMVKCEFSLPAVTAEDTEVVFVAGDYGNPPGSSIDAYVRRLTALPYFAERLSPGDKGMKFVYRQINPEQESQEPGSPMSIRFSVRLKYEDRLLTNE